MSLASKKRPEPELAQDAPEWQQPPQNCIRQRLSGIGGGRSGSLTASEMRPSGVHGSGSTANAALFTADGSSRSLMYSSVPLGRGTLNAEFTKPTGTAML
jgi:hypothetical protein